ncbi:dockerin type I repeat-containing protein [Ruminococcus flavefaciens]|uniref:Dockerin domain-containing protein n=1 Tax=Ruminococcus flavefaciens TaxID=1265 RepID=A0A1M7KF36_RUMFL|nr:dockerin type I repeat-containing protein [Ruminococcus flavefaciens]SHM63918.1 hypothetical protein SAMN04487860_108100 [Ruminococcus flavefaciens]
MSLKKLTAAFIAAATAISPLSFTPHSSAAIAEGTVVYAALPDWIPSDFDSAAEFRNTYGATHIDNGLICIVYPDRARKGASKDTYGYELKPSEGMGTELKHEIYTHELTETCFDVFVYQPQKQGEIDLTIVDPHVQVKETDDNWKPPAIAEYNFKADQGLNITETDIFSWLPDGSNEYYEYTKKNGEVSVKDNYVVFCTMTIDQFGDKWEPDSNNKYENIKYLLTSDCTMQVPDLYDDGSIDKIYLYQAVQDGIEKISWIRTSHVRPDPDEPTSYTLTADCAVLNNAKTILLPGQMRASAVDCDTDEPIEFSEDTKLYISTSISNGECATGPILAMETNPAIVDDNLGKNFNSTNFTFRLEENSLPKNYSFPDNAESMGYYGGRILPNNSMIVTRYDNDSTDVIFKLKYNPTGDVNDDGEFNVSDVVLLQKWLLGSADAEIKSWESADFCHDNKLDVFDLIKMRQKLIETLPKTYVEPEHRSFGGPIRIIADDLKLYPGPDESYEPVAIIYKNTILSKLGYQDNNDKWIFTNYNDQYGWIKTVADDDKTPTIVYESYIDKPVIYLYPEHETDIHVELELTEAELSTTYPKYNNGWNVTAYPDGKLLNKADGTHHRYLFWDAANCRTRFDHSKGFCVAGSDTESFLREKLTYMGLNEDEMNEFIVYWLPLMEHNKYNLISFQGDAYTNSAKLNISPAPDSLLRIFMTYVPLENAVDIEPQQLPTFERKGFTVVEWGGSKIR